MPNLVRRQVESDFPATFLSKLRQHLISELFCPVRGWSVQQSRLPWRGWSPLSVDVSTRREKSFRARCFSQPEVSAGVFGAFCSVICFRMKSSFRIAVAGFLCIVSLAGVNGYARNSAARRQEARSQFETAERMREALNGRPTGERTRREYQRVIDAYRKVYYVAPASSKADASVMAVGELLAEMGRQFEPGERDLRAAISQYEFLGREYPGSKYRFEALFTIGQIYKEDLGDNAAARKVFQEFLRRYPRHHLAREAKFALKDLNEPQEKKKAVEEARAETTRETHETPVSVAVSSPTVQKKSAMPLVTGIRHWSTPDYTRVAIDVDGEVKYEAGRVPGPDRIFFDLPETKLASTLVGKNFDVEDGFLKKIRVAQYRPGSTRVVLEVDNVSDYSAFLLPNPYRLIIDVHGRQERTRAVAKASVPPLPSDADASPSDQPVESRALMPATRQPKTNGAAGVDESTTAKTKTTPAPASDSDDDAEDSGSANSSSHMPSNRPRVPMPPSATTAHRKTIVDEDDNVTTTDLPAVGSKTTSRAGTSNNNGTGTMNNPASSGSTLTSKGKARRPAARTGETTTVARAENTDDPLFSDPGDSSGPEMKATTQPTAAPTAVAVAPRSKSRTTNKKTARATSANPPLTVREAVPTSAGDRSLIRALGLKIGRIVIDAGHGGHDTGTIGPNGLLEKDLVLDVALRLGRELETRLGADVIYTRDDDTFIPLETRTAIANQHQADLFISVHANSSPDPAARGVETYYLNFTSSPDALEVAARENAVSQKSIYELSDLVKKIALKEKINESRELAMDVQNSLYSGLATRGSTLRDRGVKKAPFVVLIGANMPSILAEISFVSNPTMKPSWRPRNIARRLRMLSTEVSRSMSKASAA